MCILSVIAFGLPCRLFSRNILRWRLRMLDANKLSRRWGTTTSDSNSTSSGKSLKPGFALEEALYLTKEAGIITAKERQLLIVKSPIFSPDKSPFVLENFFSTIEEKEEDFNETGLMEFSDPSESSADNNIGDAAESESVPAEIHRSIIENFNPKWKKSFRHNNQEWLEEAEGRGTCKRAAAHVIIRRGNGQVRVNKDEDVYSHWPYYYNRMDVLQPFYLSKTAGIYDLFIHTRGGGLSGQSRATRLAVARALVNASPSCAEDFAEDSVLYEDKRQKMPKMPGRKGARKMKSWSKR
ncbi:putative ribosomal protein S9 [Cardiosporidium cionae]|uniref:Ribosomal protein S9 n=1 Tax=Cardiosporidium cionae TaxID=476202 RepID=A0ABQ7JDD0_9APIC|nr:putative ribosomal protein S9 [Cardiosporidium cionae]|eukprot:KAF8822005.1 putative ribosomal protein S9 [Cardiosporidium cionae]